MRVIRHSIVISCILVLLGCMLHVLVSEATQNQNQNVSKKEIDQLERIPEPKTDEIRSIRTARDWPNPFVIVNSDGFHLILNGDRQRVYEQLPLSKLEKMLLNLGLDRWPLGRVVAVAENGLRSPGDNDEIAEKCKEVKHMLESHRVRIELWPSG